MTVRRARADDVATIVDIHNELLMTTTYEWTETPHTMAEWRQRLSDKSARGEPVLVVEDEGQVVGWTTYGDFRDTSRWPGYRFTVEHTILLTERSWGRGLGRVLLTALVDEARRAGKRVMVGGIDSTNDGSVAFHVKCGFVEVARMPGVGEKWGRRLDLILMQRTLR